MILNHYEPPKNTDCQLRSVNGFGKLEFGGKSCKKYYFLVSQSLKTEDGVRATHIYMYTQHYSTFTVLDLENQRKLSN